MDFCAYAARFGRRLFGSFLCCPPVLTVAAAAGFLLGAPRAEADSYDLRTYNRVTPVKDQGSYGNCWSYAALSSVESSMLVEGLASNPNSPALDFSQSHLSRFYGGATAGVPLGGGNRLDSLSYFASGRGPVLESQYPFPGNDGDPYSSNTFAPSCWVTAQQWIDPDNSYHPATIQDLKNAITSQGAVETEMYWDGGNSFNSTTGTYCYSGPSMPTNHAVSIVGWNDAMVTQSSSPAPGW